MRNGVPPGWTSTKLSELVLAKKGKKPAVLRKTLMVGFVPYLDIKAIEKKEVCHFAEAKSSRLAAENDLFVVWDGARSGWVGTGMAGAIGSTIMALTPRKGNPAYLLYFITSHFQAINKKTRGTGIPHVDPEVFWNLEVPLPPLPEQRRIVAKLENLLAKADACQQRLAKIPILLKRFRQSVLAAACSGRLTADWRERRGSDPTDVIAEVETDGLPIGWKSACVGDIIKDLRYGTAKRCSYEKQGVPVLRIPNVANGTISHTDLKYAELPPKELGKLELLPGDILLVRSNGSVSLVGKCALVRNQERGFAYAGYLIRIRPKPNIIESEFLNLALSSYDVRLQIELEARSTSGVHNINGDEVRALRISLPPLAEQQEIIRRVKSLFALADQIEARCARAQAYADNLTQSILTKAFRGELIPNGSPNRI